FVSRDVPTGSPSSNGTIIPIPIPSFPLLVNLHSKKFIRTKRKAESWSAKRERAQRRKGQRLQPNRNEQGRNDMRFPGHPHLERRVEVFGPVALPVPPSSGDACVGGAPAEIRLEALSLPTSQQLMAVGHDY
nr:cytochrome c maturation protein CcmFc, mitochondrial [Tanacetum cinerariifolium]